MKVIYLNIDLARRAVQDKHHLEALAFNILAKKTYTSSMVNDATIRVCKEKFHIGTTRMSRIIRNGIEYGLLKRVDNSIVATKIKAKGLNNRLEFEDRDYTLSEVIDMIRNSLILDHVRKQTYVVDTVDMARDPSDLTSHKVGKKRLRRMPMIKDAFRTLSNKRIMEIANVKRYRTTILMKKLVRSGKVVLKKTIEETPINPKNFTSEFQDWYRTSGASGSLFLFRGKIYCKLSNVYRYNCDAIRVF